MGDNSHISSFSMIRFDIKMLGTRAIINLFSHSFSFSFLLLSTMNEPDLLSKCLEHKEALNLATLSLLSMAHHEQIRYQNAWNTNNH
jgi:hypothetical protein